MTPTAELVWDARCGVGESCVWDAERRRILFADIPAGRIYSYGTTDGQQHHWTLPDVVGSFGLSRSGRLVVALRHRVVLFDTRRGLIEDFTSQVDEPVANRFNDGKVGPDGCFWVGTMDGSPARGPTGALYRISPDGRIERKADGYVTSNGLAWSPDGQTMFHSDSRQCFIDAWDFDATRGRITNRRRIATLSDEEGRPDGAATDAEGCYWSAGVSAGCLNRFSPTGELLDKIAMPVPTPTMPCFAADAVYVTSLRDGRDAATLDRYPGLGGLFRLPAPLAGAPVGLFADI
jgi:sugar lactone lactonase YvrE